MQTFHPGIKVSYASIFPIQIIPSLQQHYGPQGTRPKFSSSLTFPQFHSPTYSWFIIIIIPSPTCFLSLIVLSFQNSNSRSSQPSAFLTFLSIESLNVAEENYITRTTVYFNVIASHLKWTQYHSTVRPFLSIKFTFQYLR